MATSVYILITHHFVIFKKIKIKTSEIVPIQVIFFKMLHQVDYFLSLIKNVFLKLLTMLKRISKTTDWDDY